jgi:hypothetical protein
VLRLGTQNYTCDVATGTFFTNGTAQAALVDVTSQWMGTQPPADDTPPAGAAASVQHFFVANPNDPSTVVPRFQSADAFFDGSKTASVASSDPSFSVATVLLSNIAGTLAKNVVRTNTNGGVVPAGTKCTGNQATAVAYHANYLFFD